MYAERDEGKRQAMLKEMTREILDKAPYIWLPTPYIYTAWWPWVKNYNGELRAGVGASGADLCAHLGRPGLEEEAGLLRRLGYGAGGAALRRRRPCTPWLSPSCRSAT